MSPSPAPPRESAPRALSVVMVSASFHPYVGGAEKQALELSVALARRGLSVRVLTRRLPGLDPLDRARDIPVLRLWTWGKGFVNSLTFMLSLTCALLKELKTYDVIHVHLAGSPALSAALVGVLFGKRVIVKIGGGRGVGELGPSMRTFSGRLKLKVLAFLRPRLVAVSSDLAEEIDAAGLGRLRVDFFPNGVDTEVYRPYHAQEKLAMRIRLGWPKGLCFLYTGRLSPEKRLYEFMRAWSAIFPGGAESAFVVLVGTGPEEERLRRLAQDLENRLLILPPMDDLQPVYAAADLFVLPSISEGLSNSLLEAMASGLPVLASRVGGNAQLVEEGRSGFLFAPEDIGQLKDQLRKILAHPELLPEMGRAGRETVIRKYPIESIARAYERLYREPRDRS